jgi:tetratricopeptide (TPR) repeat protein
MANEFPIVEFKNWAKCQELLPHVDNLYESGFSGDGLVQDWANLLNNAARYMETRLGKYDEAEKLNRRALEEREKELGDRHPDTLTSVNNLALVLQYQGKYDEAEKLSRRALEGTEKKLGAQHPDTLVSVHCLVALLRQQKRYEEAWDFYQRACDGFTENLGAHHPTTLGVSTTSQLCSKRHNRLNYNQVGIRLPKQIPPLGTSYSPENNSRSTDTK